MNRPAWLILLMIASCTGALSVSQGQMKQWLSEHPEEKSQIWTATRDSAAYLRQVRERVRAWVASREDTEPPAQSPANDPPSHSQIAACAADTVPCAQPESLEASTQWPIQRAFQRGTSSLASQLLDSSQGAQHHITQDATIAETEAVSTAQASVPEVPTPPWRARVASQLAEAPIASPAPGIPETSPVQSTALDSASLSNSSQPHIPTPPGRAQAWQRQGSTPVGLVPNVPCAASHSARPCTGLHVMHTAAQRSIPPPDSRTHQPFSHPTSGTPSLHVGGAVLPDPGAQACMQVCTLANGLLPDADTVLSCMAQYPAAGPLWHQEGQAGYLYDSTGRKVIGVYCRGPRGGSVNVYLSGKVVVQGNPSGRAHLLGLICDWTVPRVGSSSASSSRPRPSLARFRVQEHGQPY